MMIDSSNCRWDSDTTTRVVGGSMVHVVVGIVVVIAAAAVAIVGHHRSLYCGDFVLSSLIDVDHPVDCWVFGLRVATLFRRKAIQK
jgi:hypothetical protein